jgi:hypothetical protein
MLTNQFSVIIYVLFWLVRINGCIRRGRQPLLRGREWFFNVRVRPNFYTGPGRAILHRYWMRMLLPFAIDIPIATAIFLSHHPGLLNPLIIALSALIHINHVFSVDRAERQARPFAVAEPEQPVTCAVASLTRRRLADYSYPKVELTLAVILIAGLVWLARYYSAAPEHQNLRQVFAVPMVLLYLELGLLLVKSLIVRWRSPIPLAGAAEYVAARERIRKYYLWTCDCYRIFIAATIVFWAICLWVPASSLNRVVTIWMGVMIAIGIVLTIWVEMKRKQLADLAVRTSPARLPDLLPEQGIAKRLLCYERSAPMLLLKGARGYSINLANRLNCAGAAYLVGLAVLLVLLRSLQ